MSIICAKQGALAIFARWPIGPACDCGATDEVVMHEGVAIQREKVR
jgi:hypothetical protein